MFRLAVVASALCAFAFAQTPAPGEPSAQSAGQTPAQASQPSQSSMVKLPAGTKVLLVLKNSVSSKNAKPGDGVYLESTFPVTANGKVVIPAGTYVQGAVDSVKRSGRVKGRAELLLHFTTLIYPNGYTVTMPGGLESTDSSDSVKVKDQEGTVQADGTKGRDATTVATSTGTGTLIGGLSHGAKGALIGGGIGAAVGVVTAMLTRGDEVRLESGSSVEMVLQRPLEIDMDRIDSFANRFPPQTPVHRRLSVKPEPDPNAVPGVGLPR